LVRTRQWSVLREEVDLAVLAIEHKDASVYAPFRLELEVRLGASLRLSLTHHNLDNQDASCRGALHTYLRANAANATVRGLGPSPAFDKVRGEQTTAYDPIRFLGKTDLVVSSEGTAMLDDGMHQVEVHRMGAPDAVLWNPGTDRPGDIPPGGEREFVCVEAAAVAEPWVVPAGGERCLGMELKVL